MTFLIMGRPTQRLKLKHPNKSSTRKQYFVKTIKNIITFLKLKLS